jgi:hypothetical protein
MKNAYKITVLNRERKRKLASHRSRSKDNIKMDLEEIGCDGVNWLKVRTSGGLL